uniref:Uncharacterized protein n=1 Tax=Electrophorus electricus TaxID=8005 RepID=A0A4W4F2Y6_ELEEL
MFGQRQFQCDVSRHHPTAQRSEMLWYMITFLMIYNGYNLDSSTPALSNGIWHSCPRRINHRHEANKAQVLSGKVHLLNIKSKALWELVIREVEMAETCKRGLFVQFSVFHSHSVLSEGSCLV